MTKDREDTIKAGLSILNQKSPIFERVDTDKMIEQNQDDTKEEKCADNTPQDNTETTKDVERKTSMIITEIEEDTQAHSTKAVTSPKTDEVGDSKKADSSIDTTPEPDSSHQTAEFKITSRVETIINDCTEAVTDDKTEEIV